MNVRRRTGFSCGGVGGARVRSAPIRRPRVIRRLSSWRFRRTARACTSCAREPTKSWSMTPATRRIAPAHSRRPRSQGAIALGGCREAPLRRQFLERFGLGNRHRLARGDPHLPAGFEPNAAIADRDGRFLYVANRISNDISVVDLATGREAKRLAAGRGASYLAHVPGWQPDLRHAHLPAPGDIPNAAGIGNHGHRYRAGR